MKPRRTAVTTAFANDVLGIYTQKQIDELRNRNQDLWNRLNELHAFLDTYGTFMLHGPDWHSKEEIANKMLMEAKKTLEVMHNDSCYP